LKVLNRIYPLSKVSLELIHRFCSLIDNNNKLYIDNINYLQKMKFTCKTINLKEGISKVERIVSKQTTLPILGNILISSEKGRLVLAATNLEIAIKVYIGAKIEKEGSITIPARIIGGFLNTIKDEVVSGELEGAELKITTENHKIKIKGIDAKDFPIIPDVPDEPFFSIQSKKINKAISGVLVSVAHNDTRQELNGVLMKFKNKGITLASTDSFRLTEIDIKGIKVIDETNFETFKEKKNSIIIPALALMEVQRIARDEEINVIIEQNQLFISTSETKIVSRLINGNYPEYKQVLPKKFDIELEVEKEKLTNAVKIASLVTNSQNGEVNFKNTKELDALLITAQSMDSGDNLSKIPTKIKGSEFEILFNCRFILEGLASVLFDSEKVLIKLNKQKSPVMFKKIKAKGEIDESFSYIIMPIVKS
jgi:DNA polymerase III subunit beta